MSSVFLMSLILYTFTNLYYAENVQDQYYHFPVVRNDVDSLLDGFW